MRKGDNKMKLENGVLTNVQNRDIPKRGKITAEWIGWHSITTIGDWAFWGCTVLKLQLLYQVVSQV